MGLRDKLYKKSLSILKLPTLERRCANNNLIFLHKIIHGFYDISHQNMFPPLTFNQTLLFDIILIN